MPIRNIDIEDLLMREEIKISMDEVVECLHNKEVKGQVVIDDTLKAAIDAYYEQYGVK